MELERTSTDRKPDLNRNYHVATSRDEIREVIRRRASRSSECSSSSSHHHLQPGSSPGKAGTSPCRGSPVKVAGSSPCKDLDDMDAWEISMRLDMADIQRKYRQVYTVGTKRIRAKMYIFAKSEISYSLRMSAN